MQTETQMTRAEAITQLQANGFGIVYDGSAVIVIDPNGEGIMGKQGTARRYDSPELAAKILLNASGGK